MLSINYECCYNIIVCLCVCNLSHIYFMIYLNLLLLCGFFFSGFIISLLIYSNEYALFTTNSNLTISFIIGILNGFVCILFLLIYSLVNLKHLISDEIITPISDIFKIFYIYILPELTILWLSSSNFMLENNSEMSKYTYGFQMFILYIYIIPIVYTIIIIILIIKLVISKKK
jgi:hypothetical protein